MTTTDRRDADDATFTAEMDRVNRLEVADESAEERVARAMWTAGVLEAPRSRAPWDDASEGSKLIYRRLARAAIAELAAPGTDSSGQVEEVDQLRLAYELMVQQFRTMQREKEHGWREAERWEERAEAAETKLAAQLSTSDSSGQAVQRVLDLAEELDGDADTCSDIVARLSLREAATRLRAVTGPQRDHGGEGGQ